MSGVYLCPVTGWIVRVCRCREDIHPSRCNHYSFDWSGKTHIIFVASRQIPATRWTYITLIIGSRSASKARPIKGNKSQNGFEQEMIINGLLLRR